MSASASPSIAFYGSANPNISFRPDPGSADRMERFPPHPNFQMSTCWAIASSAYWVGSTKRWGSREILLRARLLVVPPACAI